MAITKFVKNPCDTEIALSNLCSYIIAPIKTCNGCYTGGRGITPLTAYEEICEMQNLFNKSFGRRAYHFVVSFEVGSGFISYDAMDIAFQISDLFFPEYQILYGVHTDRDNLHIHFAVNPVSLINGKKLHLDFQKEGALRDQINIIIEKYILEKI